MFFKKIKGEQLVTPIVFLITALRVYSYIPVEKLFFAVFERTITDFPRFFATIGLTIIFSLLIALFTGRVLKENQSLVPLAIIFVADPVFLSSQDNISVLLLSSLFMLCAYAFLRTENLFADAFIFSAFAFLSALLIPETIFSIIPLSFAMILVKYFGTFSMQKTKTASLFVFTASAIISAYILNNSYKRDLFLANKFLNGKTSYLYKPSFLLLVFSVLIFIGCLILLRKILIFTKGKSKKKNYEYINEGTVSVIFLTGILIAVCFVLQTSARIGNLVPPASSAMNICAPMLIIFVTIRYKNSFDSVLNSIRDFWSNHFGICFIAFFFLVMLYFKLSKDCFSATNILKYATLYLT